MIIRLANRIKAKNPYIDKGNNTGFGVVNSPSGLSRTPAGSDIENSIIHYNMLF
jgi:hypothetical protein